MALFRNLGSLSKLTGAISSKLGAVPVPTGFSRPIAIDFGCGSLKVLQIGDQNPPTLIAAACLETPRELMNDVAKRLAFQVAALPKLIRHGGFRGKRAVCAIPAWQMLCKQLQVPRQDNVPLASLVEAALPTQLNVDPASVVYRYEEIAGAGGSGKSDLIVIATPRDLVERLMRALQHAKLEPVGMQTEFTAILRAFDHVHRREGDLQVSTLYIDIGAGTTKVAISHGTNLAFARIIQAGGMQMDETLAAQLKCEPDEARRRRLATGATLPAEPKAAPVPVAAAPAGGGTATAEQPERRGANALPGFGPDILSQPASSVAPENGDLTESLEILTDEISMCLRYHAGQFPGRKVERAVFIGGEARHRGLCQQIARRLRLPAQMADPMARVARTGNEPALGVDLKQPQPGWAVALGLCLCQTDL